MRIIAVIPARYASSRLPGKPLVQIAGESMIRRTYLRCVEAMPEEDVFVATDDDRIRTHCENYKMQVVMTSPDCLTGTDRVAEVAERIAADVYINVQGDEPLCNPADIRTLLAAARQHPADIINGFCPIAADHAYTSRSVPKVVVRPDGRLLYMSRSPIPGGKSPELDKAWRQVCIYAFPKAALAAFAAHDGKTELEAIEDIEILRFLEMGLDVRMVPMSDVSIAVDHPEDVLAVEAALREGRSDA